MSKLIEKLNQALGLDLRAINLYAHYAAYAPNIKEKKVAVVTLDSEGDGLNQTFWIFDRNKNKLKKINESSECDLARIYRFITLIFYLLR